jgi:phosphate transport system permease protein
LSETEKSARTPLRRVRKTRRSVVVIDRIVDAVIRTGGLLVIFAVLGICVFLALVVLPLFGGAELQPPVKYALPSPPAGGSWIHAEVNEHSCLGLVLGDGGELAQFNALHGGELSRTDLIEDPARRVVAFAREAVGHSLALALDDGSLVLGELRFEEEFFADETIPEEAQSLATGSAAPYRGGMIERVTDERARWSKLVAELRSAVATGSASPVTRLDFRISDTGEVLAYVKADGRLVFSQVSTTENLLTGEITSELIEHGIPYDPVGRGLPSALLLPGRGDQLIIAWADGSAARFDLRRPDEAVQVETVDLVPGAAPLTAIEYLIGEQVIVAGGGDGSVTTWFRIENEPGQADAPSDGFHLVAARELQPQAAAITAIAPSARNKTFVTAAADGSFWIRHHTTARVLSEGNAGSAPKLVQMAPKSNGLLTASADGAAAFWPLENPHPETTFGTIFRQTWYEGYPKPAHTWQSSSGTDDFEPKLGLMPLIFGTLKATIYAMLFSVPIALLAAIYTSEFMSRRMRAIVKPKIEMMASLPSVVLGFLAALVLAPWIENWVLAVLTTFLIVPLAIVAGAYGWLFLPTRYAARFGGWHKFIAIAIIFLLAVAAAFPAGALVERMFFGGDFRSWLSPPHQGSGAPVWWLILLPLTLLAVVAADRMIVSPRMAQRAPSTSAIAEARRELFKGALTFAAAALLSLICAQLLTLFGLDPRDLFLGTYVQRNSLVVGFVMGFAVIPIIYTVTEDALSSVPDHLRGAALGCGATTWQTASRVVVPVAASGIFSAIMIGLGRAVGETMIVVLAAGNTAIMDVNPFNGLRSLSATIAYELPEAAVEGTLYRMLFLAALTLFLITFVVNTLAEVVRQRFRKRAFEL